MEDIFLLARIPYLAAKLFILLYLKPITEVFRLFTPDSASQLKKWDMQKVIRGVNLFFILPTPPFRPGLCLKKSLILYRFLRENGIDVKINIGFKSMSKKVRGHAWLTLHGRPYLTPQRVVEKFNPCFIYPS